MLRTVIGLLIIFFILRFVWKIIGFLSPPPQKKMKSKPPKPQKPILKGGEYVTYEEVKE